MLCAGAVMGTATAMLGSRVRDRSCPVSGVDHRSCHPGYTSHLLYNRHLASPRERTRAALPPCTTSSPADWTASAPRILWRPSATVSRATRRGHRGERTSDGGTDATGGGHT